MQENTFLIMIKKPASAFDGDGFYISRILARQSSVGHSLHVLDPSLCQATVPFEWEMRPGTPKNPQQEQMIPPLSPPPSMHSLGHHLPSIDHSEHKGSTPKTSKFWSLEKTVRKIIKVVLIPSKRRSRQQESSRFGYDLSDGEFVASSFSSCSSSSIPSNGRFNDHLSGLPRDSSAEAVRCIPGKMTASLVRIARRV